MERTVEVRILKSGFDPMTAKVMDFSDCDMKVLSRQALPVSGLVEVRANDALLLGEVIFCVSQDMDFLAGIHIEHVLGPLSVLADLYRPFSFGALRCNCDAC